MMDALALMLGEDDGDGVVMRGLLEFERERER